MSAALPPASSSDLYTAYLLSFLAAPWAAIFVSITNYKIMSIRERFVENILQDEGRRLLRNQSLALKDQLTFHTGRLYGERHIQVTSDRLTFTHTAYERFLDMRRLNVGGHTIRRNRKIHNRFVYGHYNSIINRLLYDFTESAAAQISETLNTRTNGNH